MRIYEGITEMIALQEKKSGTENIYWQKLSDGFYHLANEQVKNHNLGVLAEDGRRNDPRLVKPGQKETMNNIIRLWCKQTASKIKSGQKVITNAVSLNRKSARAGMRSPSGTSAHLGKLAYAGILVGQECDACTTYPQGVEPVKNFHGTCRDFEILIDPAVIPQAQLERIGISFFALDAFGSKDVKDTNVLDMTELSLSEDPKRQNLAHRDTMMKTLGIKELQEAASAGADNLLVEEDGNDPKAVDREEEATPQEEEEGAGRRADQNWKEELRARRQKRERAAGADDDFVARMLLEGQRIEGFARLLLEGYAKKLIPAMGRAPYHATEMQRGYEAAINLLKRVPAAQLDEFTDRMLFTIDHMREWLERKPGAFVREPSAWFSPDNRKSGILGAERRFLRVYEERRKEFQDLAFMFEQADRQRYLDDAELVRQHRNSDYLHVAFEMKKILCKMHSTDTRLKEANLRKWANDLKLIVKKDRYKLQLVVDVANWWLNDASREAEFWRSECGGYGIRSAGGFRRNFGKILDSMRGCQNQKKA